MPRRSELRITKRTVDALTVGEKDTVFWDRDLAGFGVRVHATGRKTYVVQSRGSAGPKRVTLGLHGDLSADEARKQAAVVIDRIKQGEDPVPVVPETELTVAALAERFMRVHVDVHCKPSTIATYRGVLERHIVPALGGMALSAVGRREIATLHHGLRDKPCTANAAVRIASSMFQRAEAWELITPGSKSVPLRAPLQAAFARAVPDVRGVQALGACTERSAGGRLCVAAGDCGHPAADAHGMPTFGDSHVALGRRGPYGR